MKKLLVAALMTLVFSHAALTQAATYGGGSGTAESPYEIWTPQQMNTIGANPADWDKHFVLMDNIDMSIYTGTQYKIIGNATTPFRGTFDGNNHKISNLTYATTEKVGYVGLFGRTDHATIQNLGVENLLISSRGSYVGGLVGEGDNNGSFTACYATGSVSGTDYVGGLMGRNDGPLTACYATGSVSGTNYIGGLVGFNLAGSLTACYASGSVKGTECVGGLVGWNHYGPLTACYATGLVTGSISAGGLVGQNGGSLTAACFWDIETCGQMTSAGGIGKTTAEMQTLSTFIDAGWDFAGESANGLNDYWQIEVNGYPHFTVHAWTLEGEGTSDSPYMVANPAELGKVWLRPSACYRLAGNLDLSGISWSSAVVPLFTGSFEGRGFVISNLMINWPDSHYMGLFGKAEAGSQISNLGLENVNLTGRLYVGGLVGDNGGPLTACYVTGLVSGMTGVGGLVGDNDGTLTSCYATDLVSGTECVGGLVGWNDGALTSCYATGTVSGTDYVGGLVGTNNAPLTACCATGSVSGIALVGGLVGDNNNNTPLTACYATGSVNGTDDVGGLVGWNYYGPLTACYATGLVTGSSSAGGLVGRNSSGSLTACFWDIETSSQSDGVGLGSSSGATGLDTAEMMTLSTFTDAEWDFSETDGDPADWMLLREGEDYPRLAWQTIYPGDITGLYGVDMTDLTVVIDNWLRQDCPTECEQADIDSSGTVDLADLSILAADWIKQ